ncbi:MAG: hypothetical protein ACT4P7_22780 [Gemmatimonadaceae bacterium]
MLDARRILTFFALALPFSGAEAQARRQPVSPSDGPPSLSPTELLNRRRDLDLTPRQVARLDSIERAQFTQRRSAMLLLQRQRDSLCANRRPCVLSQEERESLRAQIERDRPRREAIWRNDSAGRAVAMSLLDSTQRGRVQGFRQQQRRAGMARMGRDFRPRMGREFQGGRRFADPRGSMRRREFAPRFDRRGLMGPGFDRGGPPFGPREFRRRGMREERMFNRDAVPRRRPMAPPGRRGDDDQYLERGLPDVRPDALQ